MNYIPPKDEYGNEYYVPVVCKNKDFLIGYIRGLDMAKEMINDSLTSVDINIDLGPMDVILDSTRFNDILINGKHESDMTDEELKQYITDIVEEVTDKFDTDNIENNVYDDDEILNLECSCGLGFYSWQEYEKIPKESFKCDNCGKILIHYTGDYDYEYEYAERNG